MAQRVAILGAGRSGVAVAKAALAQGHTPTVFDAKPASESKFASELAQMYVELVSDFHGSFARSDFDMLVTSPGVDMRSTILKDAERSGIEVIGEIEFAYRIAKAPIIAITGTNGKSTTTVMTYLALRAADANPILCGNIYGSGLEEVPLTEAALNATENQVLVAEISSFQLEWVRDFRPRCAGITNISPDHLNRYDHFDQYAQTKRRLFDRMGQGDTIVANAGDPNTFPRNESLRDRGHGHPHVRFYGAAGVDASFDIANFKLSISEPIVRLPFHEKHNLLNACHAALLALNYLESIDSLSALDRIQHVLKGLHQFKGLAHRMERLGHRNGIEVINNSMCTNPAALVASSSCLMAPQRLLIGGRKKNYDFRVVGEHLERTGHDAYLFGHDALEISEELGGRHRVFDTMQAAFDAAKDEAVPGDVIMLAPGCASMDQFEDFVQRGEEFRELAKEWLNDTTD